MPTLNLLFLRHGPTVWNRDKRLQGHTDIPVDPKAMREHWPDASAPACWAGRRWYCSPLLRARQTAEYFGLNATPDPALIEMAWGEWEGRQLSELRAHDPVGVARLESAGLDLRAPGGESPREVQVRLTHWAQKLLAEQTSDLAVGVVCHKGVMRAVLAAATAWDMRTRPPLKVDYRQGLRIDCSQAGWSLPPPTE